MTGRSRLVRYDVVVPTVGRASLAALLDGLASGDGPLPESVILVDDRVHADTPLVAGPVPPALTGRIRLVRCGGCGPAAARNAGWRASRADWIAFLDDDVVPRPAWRAALVDDLRHQPLDVAGVQGNIRVPLAADRRPTDDERNIAGLESARWATADMAYRRVALVGIGGFDERFRRAYREDADLALRLLDAGWMLERGTRVVDHPTRQGKWWDSVRRQAGNADDAMMRRLHGRGWRHLAGSPKGAFARHALTTGALLTVAVPRARPVAAGVWAASTAHFAWKRIAPGPRTPREIASMVATSVAIPPTAVVQRLRGEWRARRAERRAVALPPAAVLFDRDGTLVVDVPYNGDPERVRLVDDARDAVERLRRAGVRTAVISNQSGVARGLLTADQVHAVNRRVEDLVGAPLGPWLHCPHGPDDRCGCRKPEPGMVLQAAELLGVDPSQVAVIGDIGADVEAAQRAGARGVLVPTPATRAEEVEAAPEVASSLTDAVERLLGDER